jgi:hypothetical protein
MISAALVNVKASPRCQDRYSLPRWRAAAGDRHARIGWRQIGPMRDGASTLAVSRRGDHLEIVGCAKLHDPRLQNLPRPQEFRSRTRLLVGYRIGVERIV